MIDIPTDFEFKDERTYVNSSTLCEFLGEQVVSALGLRAADMRLDARFHRLVTKNGIMRCQEVQNELRSNSEFAAEFRLVSGSQIFYVYFLEGETPVVKRIATNYEVEDLKFLSPFAGSCRIKIGNALSLFENIIEANKRLHQATFTQKQIKVVNLYMKKFPFELMPNSKDWYTLNIRHIGARSHNDGVTTLNKFSFVELDIPAFEMCYFVPGVAV